MNEPPVYGFSLPTPDEYEPMGPPSACPGDCGTLLPAAVTGVYCSYACLQRVHERRGVSPPTEDQWQ